MHGKECRFSCLEDSDWIAKLSAHPAALNNEICKTTSTARNEHLANGMNHAAHAYNLPTKPQLQTKPHNFRATSRHLLRDPRPRQARRNPIQISRY